MTFLFCFKYFNNDFLKSRYLASFCFNHLFYTSRKSLHTHNVASEPCLSLILVPNSSQPTRFLNQGTHDSRPIHSLHPPRDLTRIKRIPLICFMCFVHLYNTIHRLNGFPNGGVCSVLVRLLPGAVAPLSLTLFLRHIPSSTLHPSSSYHQPEE